MPQAIVMKWLSGSWKSTIAKQYEERWYIVFNRDTARLENPKMSEKQIATLENEFMIRSYWMRDIVIDNTHMGEWSLDRILGRLKEIWYTAIVEDMRDRFSGESLYLDLSIFRNTLREKRVPESVIYQQYMENYKLPWRVIICDIDWTIAKIDHRLHHIKKEAKDRDSFFKGVSDDEPIYQVIDIINAMSKTNRIVLTSWRSNICCKETIEWLDRYWVEYNFLLMRNSWDHRQDYEVKEDLYEKCLKKNDIFFAIDDRKQVVDYWRSVWVYTLDVRQCDTVY